MKVNRIDHFVLTVHDINTTCEFYSRLLGMQVVTFRNGRKALQFGQQKINLHQFGQEFEPKALNPTPGSADFCFVTDIPLKQVINHIKSSGFEIVDNPVQRTKAIGYIESIYLHDPDGNLIEISNYIEAVGGQLPTLPFILANSCWLLAEKSLQNLFCHL